MKSTLLRKISKIHAIKCGKTLKDNEVLNSFIRLDYFKTSIYATQDEELLNQLAEQVDTWAKESPSVTEGEINDLMRNGK
jgi:hypothetical protein